MPKPLLSASHFAKGGEPRGSGLFEPQRQNNWVFYVPKLFNEATSGEEVDTSAEAAKTLLLSADSSPLPRDSSNIIELPWMNEKRKYAGSLIVDDVDITFKMAVTPRIADILDAWRRLVHNQQSGAVGWAHKYKRRAYFMLIPPDGAGPDGEPLYKTAIYPMLGVWPSSFQRGDVDHAADDYVRIVMTLTIDNVFPVQHVYTDAESLSYTEVPLLS